MNSLVDEAENEHVEDISGQQQLIIVDTFKHLVLLHIVELARIIHLVHDHLLDVVGIKLGVALHAEDAVVDAPDFILCAIRVAKIDSTLR